MSAFAQYLDETTCPIQAVKELAKTVAKLQNRGGVKERDITLTFFHRDFVIKFFNPGRQKENGKLWWRNFRVS